MVALCICVKA